MPRYIAEKKLEPYVFTNTAGNTVRTYNITNGEYSSLIEYNYVKATGAKYCDAKLSIKEGNHAFDTFILQQDDADGVQTNITSITNGIKVNKGDNLILTVEEAVNVYDVNNLSIMHIDGSNRMDIVSYTYPTDTASRTDLDAAYIANNLTITDTGHAGTSGSLAACTGFKYNGTNYYAVSDLVSDTINIYDGTTTTVASVSYVNAHIITSDDSYIYIFNSSGASSIARIAIASWSLQTPLTTSEAYGSNVETGYAYHHDGFIYMKTSFSSETIYKINTTTGELTSDVVTNSAGTGFYLGSVITKLSDTEIYIVNVGSTQIGVYDVINNVAYAETRTGVATASANGNLAFEIAPGKIMAFDAANFLILDIRDIYNTGALALNLVIDGADTGQNSSFSADPLSDACFVSMPLSSGNTTPKQNPIVYDVYCSGYKL